MISSKKIYKEYLLRDQIANMRGKNKRHQPFYIGDEVKKYLMILRKREFLLYKIENSNFTLLRVLRRAYSILLQYKMHKLGIKLGFDVPLNRIGPGFRIDHWGFLVINSKAKIGKDCHIFGDVTIGIKKDNIEGAPNIGDNVTIGAGSRILGPIKIASNCVIGANAVVTHDFLEPGSIIVGIPAKKIGSLSEKINTHNNI